MTKFQCRRNWRGSNQPISRRNPEQRIEDVDHIGTRCKSEAPSAAPSSSPTRECGTYAYDIYIYIRHCAFCLFIHSYSFFVVVVLTELICRPPVSRRKLAASALSQCVTETIDFANANNNDNKGVSITKKNAQEVELEFQEPTTISCFLVSLDRSRRILPVNLKVHCI